jgi:hypothetical protein
VFTCGHLSAVRGLDVCIRDKESLSHSELAQIDTDLSVLGTLTPPVSKHNGVVVFSLTPCTCSLSMAVQPLCTLAAFAVS